jgi:hypothetical protein
VCNPPYSGRASSGWSRKSVNSCISILTRTINRTINRTIGGSKNLTFGNDGQSSPEKTGIDGCTLHVDNGQAVVKGQGWAVGGGAAVVVVVVVVVVGGGVVVGGVVVVTIAVVTIAVVAVAVAVVIVFVTIVGTIAAAPTALSSQPLAHEINRGVQRTQRVANSPVHFFSNGDAGQNGGFAFFNAFSSVPEQFQKNSINISLYIGL